MIRDTFKAYGPRHLDALARRYAIPTEHVEELKLVSEVLPFRVNDYVLEELIDWSAVPDDPIYRLVFPQPQALPSVEREKLRAAISAPRAERQQLIDAIRFELNPHPNGQLDLNRPSFDGEVARGIQHKYRETVLFFPSSGQTCHAYCSYCFRWAQFIGAPELRFGERDAGVLPAYLRAHPEVTDVLITGGDPLVMRTAELARFVEPLLADDLRSLRTIRIGTKSLAYWPRRFVDDVDADGLLTLLEQIRMAGKEVVIVAHWSHPRELTPAIALRAIERVRAAGARVHCQAPIIRGVNDDADTWCEMWSCELALGCVPYYMFIERDTGPKHLYELPLVRAHEVFRDAYARIPGLARTVRGPVMSTSPGKVVIDGVLEIAGEPALALRFVQARDPAWVGRPFLARLDEEATWWDDLAPFDGDWASWPAAAAAVAI